MFDKQKSTYWTNNNHLIESEIDGFLRECLSDEKKFIITSNFSITQVGNDYGISLKELLQRKFKEITVSNTELKMQRRERIENL